MRICILSGRQFEKLNKCNQCDYASSRVGHLRRHLKTHSGEKSNKCNQCNYATAYVSALKKHLKTHGGEKTNKCNLSDFASSYASVLKTHLKMYSGEKSNKCNSVIMHPQMQAIWGHIWKSGENSNKCNECNFATSYRKIDRIDVSALRTYSLIHSGEMPNKSN